MWNIIFEWTDFTAKSPSAKYLSKTLNLKLINKELLLEVFWEDYLNIKDADYILKILNQEDRAVFDRHFMSLLVYWKLTNSDLYKQYIDEVKVIKDFIQANPNSVFVFRHIWYNDLVNVINKRKDKSKKKKNLTEHDLNLLNYDYFFKYISAFNTMFQKLNSNVECWDRIVVLKQKYEYKKYWRFLKIIERKYRQLNNNTTLSI